MAKFTFTYKDNPYKEGTPQYAIWYSAFVHGLNSATRQLIPIFNTVQELLEDALKHQPKEAQ